MFLKYLVQLSIFVICAQMIVHLRPKKEYEKYLKYLVSLMLFLQVLMPLKSGIQFLNWNFEIGTSTYFEEQLKEYIEGVATDIYNSQMILDNNFEKEP